MLKLDNVQVVGHRTNDKNGYTALQSCRHAQAFAPHQGLARQNFAAAKVEPKRKLVEFRAVTDNVIEVGAEITADHFVPGQFVDVTGTNQGSFHMLRLGTSVVCAPRTRLAEPPQLSQDPGKVFKGKKMAGHMGGAERVTTQNLVVVKTDVERGLVMVRGAVPGTKGGWVWWCDACPEATAQGRPGVLLQGTWCDAAEEQA